ncbi:hypothetical protein BH10ACT11_BH10ACT11_16080 [soil metagenome]
MVTLALMAGSERNQPTRGAGWRSTSIDPSKRIAIDEITLQPLRRELESTAVSLNAYTGKKAGDMVVEPHDETSPNAGAEEEIYIVFSGRAEFEVGEQKLDAPAGTIVLVEVGTHRAATATEDETTVLITGAQPGSALPVSAFEYFYVAHPHYAAGDYAKAVEVASEGLVEHPRSPGLNYQLACYSALDGEAEKAIMHLEIAIAERPESAEWAAGDEDFDAIRGEPAFPVK